MNDRPVRRGEVGRLACWRFDLALDARGCDAELGIVAAAGDAQEILGEKLVKSVALLIDEDKGVPALAKSFEDVATYVGNVAVGLSTILSIYKKIPGLGESAGSSVAKGFLTTLFPGLQGIEAAQALGARSSAKDQAKLDMIARANAKEQGILRSKTLKTELSITKQKVEQNKQTKEANKLEKAGQTFNDDLISLEAALKNEQLSENEILRLKLKKQLVLENADQAEKLAKKLSDSQAELARLAQFKPTDPFQATGYGTVIWQDCDGITLDYFVIPGETFNVNCGGGGVRYGTMTGPGTVTYDNLCSTNCITPTPTPTNQESPTPTPTIGTTPTPTPTVSITASNTPTPSPSASGTDLYIYAKYINNQSTGDLTYSVNMGTPANIGPITTSSCLYFYTINGLQIGDTVEFTDSNTQAIAGSTTVCPSGPGGFGCNYNHTVLSSGAEFVYITVDGQNAC